MSDFFVQRYVPKVYVPTLPENINDMNERSNNSCNQHGGLQHAGAHLIGIIILA